MESIEALVTELDSLYKLADVDACRENLLDRGVIEPQYLEESLDWLKALRAEVAICYGV